MISEETVKRFADSAAHEEGFYETDPAKIPTVPQRANNPCDLTDDSDIGYGVIHTSGPNGAKITIYPNITDGWNAAYRKFRRMLSGASEVYPLSLTVEQVGLKFSGDPNWGKNVASRLATVGALTVTADTTLADIAQADLQAQGTENVT